MHYISFFRKLSIASAVCAVFIFASCNPTKNLKDGQYFFTGYKIKVDNKSIDKEALHAYIRQKPNRRFFFLFRLQMGFYNFGTLGDTTVEGTKFLNHFWKVTKRGMRKIGEEPVVLDTGAVHRSTRQLQLYTQRKGYFNAISTDTIIYKKRKAKVVYSVKSGTPYTVNSFVVDSRDTGIYPRLIEEQKRTLIHRGMIYDEDIFDKERERFTDVMKSQGYYFFTKQYITYSADSALQNHAVNLKMTVSRLREDSTAAGDGGENHHQYYLNRIYIRTDYDPKTIEAPAYDTLLYKNYYFLVNKNLPERYRKDVLLRAIFMSTGDLFNINEVKYSYSRLTDLNIFRFVNIKFNEVPRDEVQTQYLLDVNILLTPLSNQDFSVETEWTHNAGNFGIAGQLVYRNKNTFKGAELFELKLKGGVEAQRTFSEEENRTLFLFNTYEIGPEASMNLKKLLFVDPLFPDASRKWNPKTRISLGANYQVRPDYSRSVTNLNFGWYFKTTAPFKFSFDVFDISSVNVQLTSAFVDKLNQIRDQGLFYSYSDHLITSGRFSLIYNNQENSQNFYFIQLYPEISGLVLSQLSKMTKASFIEEDSLGKKKAFGLIYSQYAKVELDFRKYQNFAANNVFVWRANLGFGYPYGNSIALPFEKSFFGGGSNSMRAWRFRSLGPGSYVNTFNIEQTGDIKIELNGEIRSPFSRRIGGITLEGAAFVDAGNIWLHNPDNERVGGEFTSKFLSEFAIGSGLGLRLNFTYFIFRVDAAVKLRDPSLPESERWLYFRSDPQRFAARDITYNFGIGYPF